MLIAIDAGHGGKDPGAVANGLMEKNITLKLALKTGDYLKNNYHCDVLYTRKTDVFLTLSERARIANREKADLFCSFHINSFSATAKGFETYRYPRAKAKTAELQKIVHAEAMKTLQEHSIADRGMKQKDFAVLRETRMPAVLTEVLFLSNRKEAALLQSDDFLAKIARAHADGLAQAAGLKAKQKC
ncbi:N-acetylmuramoyl-L-alanine amidase [Metabacillus fastidiosus]|uniref:N-acetylmuramoyl-L-alanine amidase n=1 Tax=Metabacillus fastidiosus TaxID=1458 RepID=UPI003D279F1B